MLVKSVEELERLLQPIFNGEVSVAGFDTETTEVPDDRFTPFGTDVRMAGFSMSWGHGDTAVDFYVAVRHAPYDWRRPARLIPAEWVERLTRDEGVALDGTWALGYGHKTALSWDPNLPLEPVLALLRRAFATPGIQWRAHNWPFDAKIVMVDGVPLPDDMMDTQIHSVLTDERRLDEWDEEAKRWKHKGHGLKFLGEFLLGREAVEKTLLDDARKVLECNSWAHLPLRTIVAPYAWQDTRLCIEVGDYFLDPVKTPLSADPAIQELIREHHVEMRHLIAMEARGIKIDVAECARRAAEREKLLPQIQQRVNEMPLKLTLNLASPTEVGAALYGPLGFPKYRGKEDTRKATLKQVRALVLGGAPTAIPQEQALAVLDALLEYRAAAKELQAFYLPLVEFADGESTIYTVLNALRAKTTRMSASKPNVQQAQKLKKGKPPETSVRSVFKPRDGHVLLAPDFSQQELRVAGHFALAVPRDFRYLFSWRCTLKKRGDCKGRGAHGDGVIHTGTRGLSTATAPEEMKLVNGFLSGDRSFDPHQIMADAAGVDRDEGKTADFALIYGAYIYKLAETLNCSFDKAKLLYESFWDQAFPELAHVKTFIGERLRCAGPEGYYSHQTSIRTLHGGRIFVGSSHEGFNYIVQRSCREILLKAINRTAALIAAERAPYHMVFPVHDQLILEAPADSLDQRLVTAICREMVEAGSASKIPMVVEGSVCRDNWAETEKLPGWGWCGVTNSAV